MSDTPEKQRDEYEGWNFPPPANRWKPGQSGNPSGARGQGWGIGNYLRYFMDREYTEEMLREVLRDKKAPGAKQAAAVQFLRAMEHPDLADFIPFLLGQKTLEQLKAEGIKTECIRKIKQKNRKVKVADGEYEEFVEREIELHDRSPGSFDRVSDRTEGTPKQTLEVKGEMKHTHALIAKIQQDPEAQKLAEQLAARLDPTPQIN